MAKQRRIGRCEKVVLKRRVYSTGRAAAVEFERKKLPWVKEGERGSREGGGGGVFGLWRRRAKRMCYNMSTISCQQNIDTDCHY